MNRKRLGIVMGMMAALALFLSVSVAAPDQAFANPPEKPQIWVDGVLYNAIIPMKPDGTVDFPHTPDSTVPSVAGLETTDDLYMVPSNVSLGTTPLVSDSAPGYSDYNGGRWLPRTVVWNEGVTAFMLTSEDAIMAAAAGLNPLVTISDPGAVFLCPVTSKVNS